MLTRVRSFPLALMALASLNACSGPEVVAPTAMLTAYNDVAAAALPDVRIAEFHYDNASTDVGEAIEISAPAGTDLSGWSVVLYNGSGGAVYTTSPLVGTVPATCGTRGVFVLNYPSNGIQNGAPDGMALVNAAGTVIEFLSYEGTFTAVGGAANGMLSTDIGVLENGTEIIGQSLQRDGTGVWSAPKTATFGVCNDDVGQPPAIASVVVSPTTALMQSGTTQQFTATALDAGGLPIGGVSFAWSSSNPSAATVSASGLVTAVATGSATISATAGGFTGTATATVVTLPAVRFSELHYDNFGTDVGEAIEIEGPAGFDLTGWSVVLYNGNGGGSYNTRALSGVIPASCTTRGVAVLTYPQDGIQNGAPDGMALIDAAGAVVEFLSYEGVFTATNGPALGIASTDIGVLQNSATLGTSLQRDAAGVWSGPSASSFNGCNGGPPPPPPGNTISFSGRTPSDPALPVGFQDQLFATMRDPAGQVVVTTFTWTSENTNASIDADGVVTALVAGTATLRATAADGTTASYALPTRIATASATASYLGNAEFGEPADGSPADDFIVRYPEYTASFSPTRGTPNWVSYNLEATHFGAEDRCDCFTFDPAFPTSFTRYTTAAYTGAGAFHGYGIDRGHLARSFDRTTGSLDNAHTFFFTNIIPQAADLNQGPWSAMEAYLGDLARFQNKEVYIVTGVAGNAGTIKDQGQIVIPTSTWKVALIVPRDQGLANVQSWADAQVIAAIMPNVPGVRNQDWNIYRTTVDAVESVSGYDLLALLNDQAEIALESNTKPPTAITDGPWSGSEGGAVALSGAGSTDPDGDALTYAWDFGDGNSGAGATTSHTWAQDGQYTVTLTVTDIRGLYHSTTQVVTVANVAPVIASFSGATLLPRETYQTTGSFTDPGADSWSATVDYGTGAGAVPLALNGFGFSLSNTYTTAGSYVVTVSVSDDDATSTNSATVTVLTPAQGVGVVIGIIDQLGASGALASGHVTALTAQLLAAQQLLAQGKTAAARQILQAVRAEIAQLVANGALSASDAQLALSWIDRLLATTA